MLNCCAHGQTGTGDSILIPRAWFRAASADLVRYDDCRQELRVTKPLVDAQRRVITLLAEDTTAKAQRIGELDSRLQSASIMLTQLEANCNSQLAAYVQDAKRQKRRAKWRTIGIGFGAAGAGVLAALLLR